MTKTVTAAIIGTVVGDGKMAVADKDCCTDWTDGRAAISAADLMAMSSGLEFNEDYGDVTDVTRMLYLEPDMAAFAAAKPLVGEVGRVFSYSERDTARCFHASGRTASAADAPPGRARSCSRRSA